MNLEIFYNNINEEILNFLLEKYPTGYIENNKYKTLLQLVTRKKDVDLLMNKYNIPLQENHGFEFAEKIDDFDNYKFWKYLDLLDDQNQINLFYDTPILKDLDNRTINFYLKNINKSKILQGYIITKNFFLKNIELFNEVCDVNSILFNFFKTLETKNKKPGIYKILVSEGLDHSLDKHFEKLNKFINKENMIKVVDNFFYGTKFLDLYEKDIISEEDFKKKYKRTFLFNTNEKQLNLLLDEDNIFKDYVFNWIKENQSFVISGNLLNYIKYSSENNINDVFSTGGILHQYFEINSNYKEIGVFLKKYIEKGGILDLKNEDNRTFIYNKMILKDPLKLMIILTSLKLENIDILNNESIVKDINDLIINYNKPKTKSDEELNFIIRSLEKYLLKNNLKQKDNKSIVKKRI